MRFTGECRCPRAAEGTRLVVTTTEEEAAEAAASFDACRARHTVSDAPLIVRLLSVEEVTSGRLS